jgi:hypothetical protein
MNTFMAVTDVTLADTISQAKSRVVLVAPALTETVARAIDGLAKVQPKVPIVIILDPDEDAYRVGYGDQTGVQLLRDLVQRSNVTVRSQAGIRIGLLIADEGILLWAPTPKSVESDRKPSEPNGIRLDGAGDVSEQLNRAVGSDASNAVLTDADIGRQPLSAEQVAKTVEALKANPPAPVDLSKMAWVFSTKIQFVECTLRGAQWTEREIKISSLLLNADVPDDLAELFDTKIRPFSRQADVAIPVQAMVLGQLAFSHDGKPITNPRTQVQIKQEWEEIQKRYLRRMRGFGLLIRRADKPQFEAEVAAFQSVLKDWVAGFRKTVEQDVDGLVEQITNVVMARLAKMSDSERPQPGRDKIEAMVREGIKGVRVVEPAVKLVFKDISWESTGDGEFCKALADVLPEEDLEGWFKVYSAAPERETFEQR